MVMSLPAHIRQQYPELPPHIRQQYPVDIPYAANTSFHMLVEAGGELDTIMTTYANGNFFY